MIFKILNNKTLNTLLDSLLKKKRFVKKKHTRGTKRTILVTKTNNEKATEKKEANPETLHVHELRTLQPISSIFLVP